jgi:hypothetical protein
LQGSKCIRILKRHILGINRRYGTFSKIAHAKPYPSILFWIYNTLQKRARKRSELLEITFNTDFCFAIEINYAVIEFLAKESKIRLKSDWKLNDKGVWAYSSGAYTPLLSLDLMVLHLELTKQIPKS